MNSLFSMYFELGFKHIADIWGYDHILFVATLAAVYPPVHWRRLLVLITGFTLGHSLTLALATLGWVNVPSAITEVLIPVTIVITALGNIKVNEMEPTPREMNMRYVLVVFFGLIHGLGFSTYLKSLLSEQDSLIMPLFAFNVGLEAGQIFIVLITMSVIAMYKKWIPGTKIRPAKIISWVAVFVGIWLIGNRIYAYA